MLAVGVTAAVLAIVAIAVSMVVERQLRENLDHSLEQRAVSLAAEPAFVSPGVLANSNDEDRFAQVIDGTGAVLASTLNARTVDVADLVPASGSMVATRDDLPIEDDAYRVLVVRTESGGAVVVGENVDDLRDTERALAAALGLSLPAVVAVLGLMVWWLVGRTLRPVEQIRASVASIGLDELDRRVTEPATEDEVARLASTMNTMLERLESSVRRERRFVADASHELRTPLTRQRATLEVELARGADADLERAARRALVDAIEMHQLVDDLLFLARIDSGRASLLREMVDLDVVVDEEVRSMRNAGDSGKQIDMSAVSAATVRGDRAQLARVVRNVLSNALRHASDRIDVLLVDDATHATLTITDDGPGIPVVERERVFERFARLDESRTGGDGGAGLGLAIAREIVTRHGGTIAIDDAELGGARVTVTLPSA